MNLIHCSQNQETKKLASLFGFELLMNYHISASKSVVSVLEIYEPLPLMSSLNLPKLPLQVACNPVVASPASGPLPSTESGSSSSTESREEKN